MRQGQEATDPDLGMLLAAWDTLPTALRVGIVAMVRAAMGEKSS
jgi:hypothetical protein